MNILVLGGGGREHSLCKSLKKSTLLKKIWCYPGNAGTAKICNNTKSVLDSFERILGFCKSNDVDLVIPGSEEYLEKGIVDFLKLNNIKVLGPTKQAAKLESSKIFTKRICSLSGIKTAKSIIYKNFEEALLKIKKQRFPLVLKLDELAAGKGVIVAQNFFEAKKFLNNVKDGNIGNAKTKILQEEVLNGEEGSFFFIADGKTAKFIGSAKDYKRVEEGNKGLNTGGMGCISPSPLEKKQIIIKIQKEIIYPTLRTMYDLGYPYSGILYAGCMFTKKGIYLIEYNVRLGDPECQAILDRLKTDFLKICIKAEMKMLKNIKIGLSKKKSVCIVLTSRGYPQKYKKGYEIRGLQKFYKKKEISILHAGTIKKRNRILTNGGRVLNIVVKKNNLREAIEYAYKKVLLINWKGMFYRNDIGS